jgi:hypothetical protein
VYLSVLSGDIHVEFIFCIYAKTSPENICLYIGIILRSVKIKREIIFFA